MFAKSILIIVAMLGEAQPLIKDLGLQDRGELVAGYPMQLFQGQFGTGDKKLAINLVVNGQDPSFKIDRVGAQPAAVTAFAAIEKLQPDLILSMGTVGAMQHLGAEVADVYLADKVIFLDRRIPIDGFVDYGFGNYQTAGSKALAKQLEVKFANLCTSNAVGLTDADLKVFKDYHCVVNDMEAAAIADLALIRKIPFYALKGVTNLLDAPTKTDGEDFVDNFAKVSERLHERAKAFLRLM